MPEGPTQRRATDSLKLTEQQKGFLDQVCANVIHSVADAVDQHENGTHHLRKEDVVEVVQMTLAEGAFVLPNGQKPMELIKQHEGLDRGQERIERRQENIERDVGKLVDVVVGPIALDWKGDPDPDGNRDESLGLKAKTEMAVSAAEKLDAALSDGGGGVPISFPKEVRVALISAAGAITTAGMAGAFLLIQTVLEKM